VKTLREKLFVSVGAILLIVALLNYFISEMWVRRELEKTGHIINENIENINKDLRNFFSFVVSYQVVYDAAELDGLSKIIAEQVSPQTAVNPWKLLSRIASFNPEIAFVQLGHQVVSPETGNLYFPRWTSIEGMLWVEIPEKRALYVALPFSESPTHYLLFDAKLLQEVLPSSDTLSQNLVRAKENLQKASSANFVAFPNDDLSFSWRDSIKKLFQALVVYETRWVEKMSLIQDLADKQIEKFPIPLAGVLMIDKTFDDGACVLTEEIFLSSSIVVDPAHSSETSLPFLLLRKNGETNVLDMARLFRFSDGSNQQMAIGFSISSLVSKIATLVKRPIIITWEGEPLAFDQEGNAFDPKKELALTDLSSAKSLSWQGKNYLPQQIDLEELQLTILTPESEALATTRFLQAMRKEISFKITLSLIVAALISFVIALLLLNNISKKFTQPIVCLSHASEELGKGKHEGLILPQLGKRHDEVATLTHSFEKMVGALQDRDKIRGVLNKVVSKEITEEILKGEIELGGEERVLTLLFSDIREFTHFSEHLDPKDLIGLLNAYMTHMCRIIDETHGVVDKFVGDEIMALYGAPLALPDHPVKAIEAALRMIQDLRAWNSERKKLGAPIFEIGIGIHTGLVCVGNMGAENRLNYTAIGANVNLASRLCSVAEPMQILVSEATYQFPGVQEHFHFQQLPLSTLKGIDHPVPLWRVVQT